MKRRSYPLNLEKHRMGRTLSAVNVECPLEPLNVSIS